MITESSSFYILTTTSINSLEFILNEYWLKCPPFLSFFHNVDVIYDRGGKETLSEDISSKNIST